MTVLPGLKSLELMSPKSKFKLKNWAEVPNEIKIFFKKSKKWWLCLRLPFLRNILYSQQESRNCVSVSSSSIVFSAATVKRSTKWLIFCHSPVACLTIFHFFKQAPSFTPVSPYTPHFLLFPTHSSCLIVPVAWLVQRSQSQRTSNSVYQSCAHFHWEPLCVLGSVAKKRTDGEQKTKETREGGREKGASTWAARFSRWGYLICPVNLRHGVDVYCTQRAHVCNDECISASLTILDRKKTCV